MLLKAGSKCVGTPAGGCCPPLSLGWGGPEGDALSIESLFSLWPSVVAFRPDSSASPGGIEVPRPVPPSSAGLFSISGGLGAVFKFLPPPSLQLPTSNINTEEIFIIYFDLQLGSMRLQNNEPSESKSMNRKRCVNDNKCGLYFEVWGWGLVHKVPPPDRLLSPPHQLLASWGTPGEIGCSHVKLLYITCTVLWLHKCHKMDLQRSTEKFNPHLV